MTRQTGETTEADPPPPRESLRALVRRRRRGVRRFRGIQYWLRVRGYYILAAFIGLFVVNAIVIGGRVAYDVTVQIDSPWDTSSPALALPLSLAGWLVVTGFAGAVAGYVVTEVTDNRTIGRRGRSNARRIGLIPLLDRLQYSRHGFEVPHYFGIRFVLRHDGDWRLAQDHWEIIVEKFLHAGDSDRGRGPRQAMWQAVLEASYVLDGMSGKCPLCQRAAEPVEGTTDARS